MITCDTHAIIFWALTPDRLSSAARRTVAAGRETGDLACADIVLWEIAMLIDKGRVSVPTDATTFIRDTVTALRMLILPITTEIAVHAQDPAFTHGDPADRLIAATALFHHCSLVTADERLARFPGLRVIW